MKKTLFANVQEMGLSSLPMAQNLTGFAPFVVRLRSTDAMG